MEPSTAAGPLAPAWRVAQLPELRAGRPAAVRVSLVNDGTATWRSRGGDGLQLAYHWLDPRGNAIVWDGLRTPFPRPVPPGGTVELAAAVVAPRPAGRYVLRLDLVEEHRFWLSEVGVEPLDVEVDVLPGIVARELAVVVHGGDDPRTERALAAQEEPVAAMLEGAAAVAHLVAGAEPAPDWSRRLLDAHEEGWAAVGPAVEPTGGWLDRRRATRRLGPWRPAGRNPRFDAPLLLPSLAGDLPLGELHGLPAYAGGDGLFEGAAVVRLPTRSGRPPT